MKWWLASLGAIVLVLLAPRAHEGTAAPWTREQAIAATVGLARDFGVSIADWEFFTTVERRPDWVDLRAAHPDSALLRAFGGLRYRVLARSLDGQSTVSADFDESGRPMRWRPRLDGLTAKEMPAPEVLARFGLGDAAQFRPAGRKATERRVRRNRDDDEKRADESTRAGRWEWSDPKIGGLSAELTASYENGRLAEVDLRNDVPRSVRRHQSAPGTTLNEVLSGIGIFFQVCAVSAGVVFLLVMFSDRRDYVRLFLVVALSVMAFYAACLLLGGRQGYLSASWDQRDFDTTSNRFGFLFRLFISLPLALAAPLAAGLLLIRAPWIESWLSILWLGLRRRAIPRVGQELMSGSLMALPLAAIPYLAWAALSRFGTRVEAARPGILMDPSPALGVLADFPLHAYPLLCIFAGMLPFLWRPSPRMRWRAGFFCAAGAMLCLARLSPVSGNGYAAVAVAVVMFTAWLWICRTMGVLALLTSLLCVYALYDLGALLAYPAGRLWPMAQVFLVWAAPLIAGLVVARRPVREEAQELAEEISRRNDPPPHLAPKSERERLMTEFAVAREAQQGMLPDRPPTIPGFSLWATCVPAREVGGDLFDFLSMPAGCWALCVADVSGKGVPAALYMTLTKGMLAAEQAMATGLLDLARAMNRQLLAAGKRRTFVTLAMGLLDPERRVLEVLRAGHNPILWWRAAEGQSRYVQPKGLGLGLAGDSLFSKSIEREELALEPGDVVVFYSDGLTEAMNPALELYGEDRLQKVVHRAARHNAAGLAQAILDDVEGFKAGADPHDDLTLVVLRCEAAAVQS